MPTLTGSWPTLRWQRLRDPMIWLWAAVVFCWLALLFGGRHQHLLSVGGAQSSAGSAALALLLVMGAWLEMVVAMMLPTTAPMLRLFRSTSARAPRPVAAMAAFIGGYLTVWMVFAVLATAAATALQAAAVRGQWQWVYARPYLLLAAVLTLAGAFQLSPLKDRCLSACRSPMLFLFAHYGRGRRAGWALGWRHGLSCLGCCWALMLIMFGTGMGNVVVMLGLTVIMLLEKVTPWGRRSAVPLGLALLAAAVLVARFGDAMWGWGLYAPLYALCGVTG